MRTSEENHFQMEITCEYLLKNETRKKIRIDQALSIIRFDLTTKAR